MKIHNYIFPDNTDSKVLFINDLPFKVIPFTDEKGNNVDGEWTAYDWCWYLKRVLNKDINEMRIYDNDSTLYEEIYETIKSHIDCFTKKSITATKVSFVKDMIKQYGGKGFTQHCERDGSIFEVTEIKLKGNNSKFKYNHHL